MEVWKDIKGYEGLYQVSNLGRVRSLPRIIETESSNQYKTFHNVQEKKGKILKQKESDYKSVALYKDKKSKYYMVHRLVAQAFISNPNGYLYVNHKDEDKYNNCVENLEWCTQSYNINYGDRNKKVSIALSGREKTKEHCLNISLSKTGKKMSEEFKQIQRVVCMKRIRNERGRFV